MFLTEEKHSPTETGREPVTQKFLNTLSESSQNGFGVRRENTSALYWAVTKEKFNSESICGQTDKEKK